MAGPRICRGPRLKALCRKGKCLEVLRFSHCLCCRGCLASPTSLLARLATERHLAIAILSLRFSCCFLYHNPSCNTFMYRKGISTSVHMIIVVPHHLAYLSSGSLPSGISQEYYYISIQLVVLTFGGGCVPQILFVFLDYCGTF